MQQSTYSNGILLPCENAAGWLSALGVSAFAQTILDDTTATAVLATLGIVATSYTPTLFNTTNLDASTAAVTGYARVGASVIVFGAVQADATAAASALTQLGMSLPVASAFTLNSQLGGVAVNSADTQVRILANDTDDRAIFEWASQTTANITLGFIFGYRVI